MKLLRNITASLLIASAMLFGSLQVTATPVSAAGSCVQGFLTFPAWYRGLNVSDTDCNLKSPNDLASPGKDDGLSNYIWKIVLNVIEIVLQLIGYLAVFFIIYGGFRFMTRGDNPSEVEAARKTIMNAVVGLVISIGSVAIVNFVFRLFN